MLISAFAALLLILTMTDQEKQYISFPEDRAMHKDALTEWIYFNFADTIKGIDGTFIYTGNERLIIFNFFKVDTSYILSECGRIVFRNDSLFFTSDSSADTVIFSSDSISVHSSGSHNIELYIGFDNTVLIEGTGKFALWDSTCYYYSYPDMRVSGNIECDVFSGSINAKGWLGHQWGSFLPGDDPYQWFSIMFDDGTNMMVFGFESSVYSFMNIFGDSFERSEDAFVQELAWYKSDISDKNLPIGWYIDDKTLNMQLLLMPNHSRFEVVNGSGTLYQGSGILTGHVGDNDMSGVFFMEYTGNGRKRANCFSKEKAITLYNNSAEHVKEVIQHPKCDTCICR